MVTLGAVMVVALLVNASLERTTATSYASHFSAELAVQNGLEAAKKALMGSPSAATSVTNDDTFLVLRADGTQANAAGVKDAYYFLAKAQPGAANTVDCYPLFSGGTPSQVTINLTATPAVQTPTAPATALPTPAQEVFGTNVKQYPQLLPFQQPAYTAWQEVRDPNDTATAPAHDLPYQRYTFWIEDLGGYIDASVAGNAGGVASGNARPLDQSTATNRYKTTPAELALFTVFNPSALNDPGDTGARNIIGNRFLLLTQATLRQLAPGAGNSDVTTPTLASRLAPDSELPLVPLGFGYTDEANAGLPKLDLNAQVLTGGVAAVDAIAKKINDNLPTFGTLRKGGLTGLDYVKTIAASIIDYADSDSAATVGPDYRGYDSYPLVNEIYTMRWWKNTYLNGSTNTYFVKISMDTWVELWNPSNQISVGTASIDTVENLPIDVGYPVPSSYIYTFGTQPADLPNNSTVATTYYPPGGPSLPINMQPNEYVTYHLRTDLFELNTGVAPPSVFPPAPSPSPSATPYRLPLNTPTGSSASYKSNYELSWSAGGSPAVVVDKAGGGIQRIGGFLEGPTNYALASHKRWSGSYPGFTYTDDLNVVKYTNPGDPRAAFYLGRPNPATPAIKAGSQASVAYDTGSSFWVRNNRPNVAPTAIYYEVKPSSWPDQGHESTRVTATPSPSGVSDPPAIRPAVSAPTSKAPAAISNAGVYSTSAELGNIYDPMQWHIVPDANNRWIDINAATVADANFGGGLSLRIGRPEFTRFDQPNLRAWQLLDLFQAGNRVNTRGLVNLNTASRDSLRVLGAGVLLNRDPDLLPVGPLSPPYQSIQADQFADAVIAGRPFLSSAQLAGLKMSGGNPIAFFGNSAAWTNPSQMPPVEWNDSGTEEYFAKVFPLTTVRSRNFRIFVTGQSLDKGDRVLSTVNKMFQVSLNPERDATGTITAQNVRTTYEALLPY